MMIHMPEIPSLNLRRWACLIPNLSQPVVLLPGLIVQIPNDVRYGVAVAAQILGGSGWRTDHIIDLPFFQLRYDPSQSPGFFPYSMG